MPRLQFVSPLRNATPEDLDVVMELERSGFEAGIVESRETFDRRIRAFPEGFLLAGDPTWGYLCAEVWSDLDDDVSRFDLGHDLSRFLDREGSILYIASMTVSPESRGSGHGTALFRSAVDVLQRRFPTVERTLLIVNEHWSRALSIYQSSGFMVAGRLPRFFQPLGGPPGDAILLERQVYRNIDELH